MPFRYVQRYRIAPESFIRSDFFGGTAGKGHGCGNCWFHFGIEFRAAVIDSCLFNGVAAAGHAHITFAAVTPCGIYRIGKVKPVVILPRRFYRKPCPIGHMFCVFDNGIAAGRNHGIGHVSIQQRKFLICCWSSFGTFFCWRIWCAAACKSYGQCCRCQECQNLFPLDSFHTTPPVFFILTHCSTAIFFCQGQFYAFSFCKFVFQSKFMHNKIAVLLEFFIWNAWL